MNIGNKFIMAAAAAASPISIIGRVISASSMFNYPKTREGWWGGVGEAKSCVPLWRFQLLIIVPIMRGESDFLKRSTTLGDYRGGGEGGGN